MNFYYFAICHVCKEPKTELKKCSHCRVLHYCSKEHQLLDWPNHKEMCKVITKVNKILTLPPNPTISEVNQLKYSSFILWQSELRRTLTIGEHHMWMFPKMCALCYMREPQIVCEDCWSVAYCSEEHQESHRGAHEKHCGQLKLGLVMHQTVHKTTLSVDWVRFKIKEDLLKLPDTIEGVLEAMNHPRPQPCSEDHVNYVCMTEFFAPAINMIYALEKSGFIENRRAKKANIVMHVVGPDVSEFQMSWAITLEYLSHWMKNLKSIKVLMIGPEVVAEEGLFLTFNCVECRAKDFNGTVAGIGAYYHDVVHAVPRPDLVVAFNSGLHEFTISPILDTWKESVPKLIRFRRVPTLLTAYTEAELNKDLERFEEKNIKFFVKPQRNPYHNLRPIRNWEEGYEPVFYQNMYVTVLAKK